MSAPIGPGDWVECVRVSPVQAGTRSAGFRLGAIYRVERAGFDNGHWLLLAEMPSPRDCGMLGAGWVAKCFRPIYRRRDGEALTAKLLEGALSGVPETVSA